MHSPFELLGSTTFAPMIVLPVANLLAKTDSEESPKNYALKISNETGRRTKIQKHQFYLD